MSKVTTKATELDVFVDGKKVGWIVDCGDCWRATLADRRRRLKLMNEDFDSRRAAVRRLVELAP